MKIGREINQKIHTFQSLKDNILTKKEKINNTKKINNKKNLKFNKDKDNKKNRSNIELINIIKSDVKLFEKIKYVQLWWKTIYHVIKIQKYLRGYLQRIKLSRTKQLNEKKILKLEQFSFTIKRIIYKKFIEKIKIISFEKKKLESPKKKKITIKNNIINNNELFAFDKVFLTSRKMNEKQKPKIKQDNLKFTNFKLAHQHSLTKRKNINDKNINPKKEKNNSKLSQNNRNNKKLCQFFYTSSNLISNKNIVNSKNNDKIKKIEISHKITNKNKKIIKHRNELNNELNIFKSHKQESLINKKELSGLDTSVRNNSNNKKKYELDFKSAHDLKFHCPKKLFYLYDSDSKQNSKNIIRVQKRFYKSNINEFDEEINHLRSRSLENRNSNKKYKSFSNKIKNNKITNTSGTKGKNISDYIKNINNTGSKNQNNNCKKDMIKWLNLWQKRNMIINQSLSNNKIKGISMLMNKIISFNCKKNGNIFIRILKNVLKLNLLKIYFNHYKSVVEIKKIIRKLKGNQKAKFDEEKITKEKYNILKKLIQKYTNLKRCLIKWKTIKNKQYIIYSDKKRKKINKNIINDKNEDMGDYINKSQPEINSLRINDYKYLKNKYNIPDIKSTNEQKNNINININYNLIANNNSLEKGVYKKKKINIPKNKKYQNNSCIIGETEQDDTNITNEQKDFMNNSMITRRIKLKKKENDIYFPKHIKPNYIQNNIDYITYKSNMQYIPNNNDMRYKKGVINKKINLKYHKILDIKNNF